MSKRLAFLIPAVALLALPRAVGGEPTPSFIPGSGWIMEAGKAATGGTTGGLPGKAMGWINDAFGKGGKAGAEALAAYEPLTKGDKAADPNHQPSGSPKVPSHCTAPDGTKTEGCNDCYAAAYRKLTAVRTALEKLRRVGATTRAFSAKSIAFGDSVSGVHGVAGLGWQPERAKIEASLTQFEKAYDAKYVELMGLLEVALKDIGQCEAKHFNQADWYDRYGFIYYTFMADRYRGQ
ncbi:MAG TPA: hypothetical protein VNJ03_06825 [Vicinamibacterales bacterium]|nr:hypothetical protein [Vicinamibacterales bacterium]